LDGDRRMIRCSGVYPFHNTFTDNITHYCKLTKRFYLLHLNKGLMNLLLRL
jgi:hypothetical protein